MTAPTIDIYQKLSDFKNTYVDAYNKTSAIFNNHVKADEPSIRMQNNTNNPNIQPEPVKTQPVKTNPVKTEPAKPNPNSRIIDLNSDRAFTPEPPSRMSIRYVQKRLANRRKRLIQKRHRRIVKTKK